MSGLYRGRWVFLGFGAAQLATAPLLASPDWFWLRGALGLTVFFLLAFTRSAR